MRYIAGLACVLTIAPILPAASMHIGSWVRRENKDSIRSTMTIEPAGSGWKVTMKVQFAAGGQTSTMLITTQGDGKDVVVYVDGKPSGQTMAIRIVDDRHTTNTLKLNGKPMLFQKSEVSADGRVIRVEGTSLVPGQGQGGQNLIEYWDRK